MCGCSQTSPLHRTPVHRTTLAHRHLPPRRLVGATRDAQSTTSVEAALLEIPQVVCIVLTSTVLLFEAKIVRPLCNGYRLCTLRVLLCTLEPARLELRAARLALCLTLALELRRVRGWPCRTDAFLDAAPMPAVLIDVLRPPGLIVLVSRGDRAAYLRKRDAFMLRLLDQRSMQRLGGQQLRQLRSRIFVPLARWPPSLSSELLPPLSARRLLVARPNVALEIDAPLARTQRIDSCCELLRCSTPRTRRPVESRSRSFAFRRVFMYAAYASSVSNSDLSRYWRWRCALPRLRYERRQHRHVA